MSSFCYLLFPVRSVMLNYVHSVLQFLILLSQDMAALEKKYHIDGDLIVCLCPWSDDWYLSRIPVAWMHSSLLLGAVLHSCLLYHFVTFEAKFGHIGVNNPYIWWSVYEHEVMIGMFKDLGSLFFTFGSKAVVHSTSRWYLILLPLR